MPDEYDMDENGEQWLLTKMSAFGPRTIFDVGANKGEWSTRAAAACPDATIHAFEIVPSTFAILADRVSELPAIIVNPFGLADRSGDVEVDFDYPGSGHNTMLSFVDHRPSTRIRCFVQSGDDYMRRNDIEHVDMVKMDVEGAEGLVLRGFDIALSRGRIDVVQFEYGYYSILSHFLLRDAYMFFEPRGYAVGPLHSSGVEFRDYQLSHEVFRPVNWIAVRRQRQDIIEAIRYSP